MQITQAMIRRVVPNVNKERLDEAVAALNMWMTHYGINTDRRQAHFISHLIHETGELKHLEENLNYSADGLLKTWPSRFNIDNVYDYARKPMKIANRAYANRMGNGDEASGDGWRYKGRGAIMLTGKEMYQKYGRSDLCIGNPVLNPEILAKFPEAYKSAMWFWQSHGLNEMADGDTGSNYDEVCKKITKVINGGQNGLSQRLYYLRKFKKEFGLK